ncbi:MAG: hypothetical protein IJH31_07320 [Erysipelotrichaceae bacterium]|nr:hypothetical protein [Erysipelotrichaceae bacterium]
MINITDERQEAIEAGNKALDSLYIARDYLDKAKSWGIYDIFAGGFISSMIKHNRMKDAKLYIEDAKRDLMVFQKELRDLRDINNIDLETGDFLGFADVLFDNIFTDIFMQRRIDEALRKVEKTIWEVEYILRNL